MRLLISAALLAVSTALFAQTPPWPPSPDHLTMPLLAGQTAHPAHGPRLYQRVTPQQPKTIVPRAGP